MSEKERVEKKVQEVSEKMLKQLARVRKRRWYMLLDHTFFATMALGMRIEPFPPWAKEASGGWVGETMAVDGRAIYINDEWVSKLTDEQLEGVIAHEVMHIACNHHTRRGKRDPKIWNIAGDYIINQILIDCGFVLPDQGCIDNQYRGMITEEVYERIKKSAIKVHVQMGGNGEVMDIRGENGEELTEAQKEEIARQVKVEIVQAAQSARVAGKLPGGIDRFIKDVVHQVLDWKAVIWRFFGQLKKEEYTWANPNRRYIHAGIYLPGRIKEEVGELVIGVDTSGSIDEISLGKFQQEINAIVSEVGPSKVHMIYCDCVVNRYELFEKGDDIKMAPAGGGGTDFRPVFAEVERRGIIPECLIYFTDLCCSSYPEQPDYPVLWAATCDGSPPFGEVLHVR